MNPHYLPDKNQSDLMPALIILFERRLLPIEEGAWVVEGVCVSARTVANAKAQPAATRLIEFAFESEDGWSVVVRAVVCQGKLWQPDRWLRLHDCVSADDREEAEVLARFADWVEAT